MMALGELTTKLRRWVYRRVDLAGELLLGRSEGFDNVAE